MMTREQRELAYQAVAILRRTTGDSYADAVSQALADVHEYETHVPQPIDWSQMNPSAEDKPETYTYWVAYRWSSEGGSGVESTDVKRSTPILTRDDITSVSSELARKAGGGGARVLAYSLMANEETK